jgi:vesicle-associated membrane protein 7
VRKNFEARYSLAQRQRAVAYSLSQFAPTIAEYMARYNEPHKIDSLARMQFKVEQLEEIERENLEKIRLRGEKIEILVEKTQTMASLSMDLKTNASSLKRQMAWKNWKWYVLGAIILGLFIYLIMVMSCDGFALKGCF